jgi:hypothetical protein
MTTAPIEAAYARLGQQLAAALVASSFIASAEALRIDPPSTDDPEGDPTNLVTAAALLHVSTGDVRGLMGGGRNRYVVERLARLELAAAAPDDAAWKAALAAAVTACAPIAGDNPTLDGLCERLELTTEEADDLPPDGNKAFLSFVIRIRSGDPLGRTA